MSFNKITKIPSKEEILYMLPLNESLKKIKNKNDEAIKNIISSKCSKLLVIIGPCSVDSEKSILEYLEKLARINEQVKEKLFLVPRIYTSKPRTTGDGYKGMIHQPDVNGVPNMGEGILATRGLDIRIIKDYGFPIADEMLYTTVYPFMEDILSYVAIGARSVESQHHRIVSSGIECAVGMKNSISGNILTMINAINTAQKSHNFIYEGYEVFTSGNEYAHGILRGGVDLNNRHFSNYQYENLLKVCELYNNSKLLNPAIIVDTNHSNSGKLFYKQPDIVKDVLGSMQKQKDIKNIIKGFMIESYIQEGADPTGKTYGKSITDPCISIDTTRDLLFYMADVF